MFPRFIKIEVESTKETTLVKRKGIKLVVATTLLGSLAQFGGCAGGLFGDGFLIDLTRSAIFEFIWDNDTTLEPA